MVNYNIVTVEKFLNKKVYYQKEIESSGKILSVKRYSCRTERFMYEGKECIFIGDRFDRIRYAPFIYVNEYRANVLIESRLQIAQAIQRYYTFCDIYSFNPEDLSMLGAEKYLRFMLGIDLVSEDGTTKLGLSVDSALNEIGMLRVFLEKMKFNTEALGKRNVSSFMRSFFGSARKDYSNGNRSITNDLKRDPQKKLNIPKHFTPFQGKQIVDLMLKEGDMQSYLIFRFGYGYGLRRGEILGLTTEDFIVEEEEDGQQKIYSILIRNRVCDDGDQRSKTLRHPTQVQHYKYKEFKKSVFKIEITKALYDEVMDYYRSSRDIQKIGVNAYKALCKATRADCYEPGGKDNHYIFFTLFRGDYYTLSGATFNNHLKKYFEKLGLILGNVSHAMRHSFAMFHAYYAKDKLSMEDLQVLMRHAWPQSTKVYYNLTDKQKRDIRNKYSVELQTIIPEFK